MKVEICANSYESARAAQSGGADRIELCSALALGGLTPSAGLLKKVINTLNIPVHVLVRPRASNFTYSDDELKIMLEDIAFCKSLGCTGIVSGALNNNGTVDQEATARLMEAAEGMHFTFHRAFDWCTRPYEAIEILTKLGVQRVLTSGQEQKATEGLELLKKLKEYYGKNIEIMPGSGISINNIGLFEEAHFSSVHLSASENITLMSEPPKVSMVSPDPLQECSVRISSETKISEIVSILKR